jgi:SOS-response transcriptional repressor LexA
VVQLEGQIGVTCKLIRFDDGRVYLIPINESFQPTSHARGDLVWALRVIARVRPV